MQRFAQLGKGPHFDFDRQMRRSRALDRGRDAAGGRRLLFQSAEPRRSFARVEHLAAGSSGCIRELPGSRGDAAQPLQEIQCNALAFQESAGAAANSSEDVAIDNTLTIAPEE